MFCFISNEIKYFQKIDNLKKIIPQSDIQTLLDVGTKWSISLYWKRTKFPDNKFVKIKKKIGKLTWYNVENSNFCFGYNNEKIDLELHFLKKYLTLWMLEAFINYNMINCSCNSWSDMFRKVKASFSLKKNGYMTQEKISAMSQQTDLSLNLKFIHSVVEV